MKKIGLLCKEISESRIKNNLKESNGFFVVKYSGLSSPDLSSLRQSLKTSGSTLFVVKNRIARRALKSLNLDELISGIEGPCGLVFTKDEPVSACGVLYNFSREHEQLKLKGGFLENKALDAKDVEVLARLPSKEVLKAQAVAALKSPITGLVLVLNQVLRKFVYCLEQVKNKKGETDGK